MIGENFQDQPLVIAPEWFDLTKFMFQRHLKPKKTAELSSVLQNFTKITKNWSKSPRATVLGVTRSTTRAMVRGELNQHSLQEEVLRRHINYARYIQGKEDTSIVKQAATHMN